MITNTTKNDPTINLFIGITAQEAIGQRELVKSSQLPAKASPYSPINVESLYNKLGITIIGPSKGDPLFLDATLPQGWKKAASDHTMYSQLLDDKGRARMTFFYKAASYDRDAHISTVETRYSFRLIEYLPEEARGKWVHKKPRACTKKVAIMERDGYITYYPGEDDSVKEEKVWVAKYEDWYVEKNNTPMYFEIYDCGNLIYVSKPVFFKNKYHKNYHSYWHKKFDTFRNFLRKDAIAYLDKRYPQWNDHFAYWD